MASFLWHHEDYVTENASSKWRHKIFLFSSPSISKILVVLLASAEKFSGGSGPTKKQDRKVASLSLPLLCQCHLYENPKRHAPCCRHLWSHKPSFSYLAVLRYARDWWSVYRTNGLPAKYMRNFVTTFTIARLSFVEYLLSASVRFYCNCYGMQFNAVSST